MIGNQSTSTPTSTSDSKEKMQQMEHEEHDEHEHEMSLTPHTLRLLRLITNCSSSTTKSVTESSRRAISLLGRIASQSHPIILWDILARLYMALTSPDESDAVGGGVVRRNRVALAMEHVAKYIPITDKGVF